MSAPMKVEAGGAPAPAAAVVRREQEAGHQLVNQPGFDVANLSDEEFQRGLDKVLLRQKRMQKLIGTLLRPDVHFGNPNDAFERDILLDPGASELRNFFRLTAKLIELPVRAESSVYCSVSVTVGLFDSLGRLVGTAIGNCNTMEKRFMKRNGQGATYTDAREKVNDCEQMAFKRAANKITAKVTGADAFFSSEEELDRAMEELPLWTEEEKKKIYGAARRKGITDKDSFAKVVKRILGKDIVCAGEEAKMLLNEIERLPVPTEVKAEVHEPRATPPKGSRAPEQGSFDDMPEALKEKVDDGLPF